MMEWLNTRVRSHPAIPDGQNPKNLSGTASDPGQQARLLFEKVQNLLRFIRDSGVSGFSRSGIAGCECIWLGQRMTMSAWE